MSITQPQNTFLTGEKKNTSRVGKDVLGFCSRCKMNLMHTIVTLGSDNKPDRVQCNTCKTERTYRAIRDTPEKKVKVAREGGKGMSDRDEELDLDSAEVAKALLGTDGTKKKAKAKAKPKVKKVKDDGELRAPSKANALLPLSMLSASADDIALFDAKLNNNKNSLATAKEYKASERFNQGDIVNHKSFGVGFVVAENGLNKLEILFRSGRKLLVTVPKK